MDYIIHVHILYINRCLVPVLVVDTYTTKINVLLLLPLLFNVILFDTDHRVIESY